MLNPCSRSSHNIVAPRYITHLELAYQGYLATDNTYTFAQLLNGLSYPTAASNVFPGYNFTAAGLGTLSPNTTSLTALQANGFSLIAPLYQSYRVRASTITVTAIPKTSDGSNNVINMIVVPTEQQAAEFDAENMLSMPYSKSLVCSANGTAQQCTIRSKMDVKTLFGLPEVRFQADSQFAALTGSNPVQKAVWLVNLRSLTSSATTICCVVKVDYEVEFYDAVSPAKNY